jgi:hypothetical protein
LKLGLVGFRTLIDELRQLVLVEIEDSRELMDGCLGENLRRGFQAIFGLLDELWKLLQSLCGVFCSCVERSELLSQKASYGVDEYFVVEKRIILPGEQILRSSRSKASTIMA